MAKPKKPAARKATVKFTSRKAGAAAPAATPAVAAPIPVAEKKRPDAPPALSLIHISEPTRPY